MSKLKNLKATSNLLDVADLLGFKSKALAYILYKKPVSERYKSFEILKSSGDMRPINAPSPALKLLQKRLSTLLQDCIKEINVIKNVKTTLSHGFKRKYSIITNANVHRNKRYVFNIDLINFFGEINFGRVRGFFILNRNFELEPDVATILAQIACHNNQLPQGSPSSPVISNLIGHLLDIRLAKLAKYVSCTYSRYADDLTFSTNRRDFPSEVAINTGTNTHSWKAGKKLEKIIDRSGFSINESKTRMQYMNSRQDVTGLIVNRKINTRSEYRHTARAMVYRLINTGKFQIKIFSFDDDDKKVDSFIDGSLQQLNGILSFIDSVSVYNRKKDMNLSNRDKLTKPPDKPDCNEKVYQSFLLYKNFYAPSKPVILCEGKTDNIYLKAAIQSMEKDYPKLMEKKDDGKLGLGICFIKRNATTGRMLGLEGGSGELINIIKMYKMERIKFKAPVKRQPIIILVDNDDGFNGLFGYITNVTKSKVDKNAEFFHVFDNLYVVATPLTPNGKNTSIEDFFTDNLKKTTLSGKVFNPIFKTFNDKIHYGKNHFAKYVVWKNRKTVDLVGFKPLLTRIEDVLIDFGKRSP